MTILKTMLLRPMTEIVNVNSSAVIYYQCALTKFYRIRQKNGILEWGISECGNELLFSLCKFTFPVIDIFVLGAFVTNIKNTSVSFSMTCLCAGVYVRRLRLWVGFQKHQRQWRNASKEILSGKVHYYPSVKI